MTKQSSAILCALMVFMNLGCASMSSPNPYDQKLPVVATEQRTITLSQDVFDNSELPLVPHIGSAPEGAYLEMRVQFAPIEEVFNHLKRVLYPNLMNRGEAHITVITPVEFRPVLESKISIQEINAIATKMHIQDSHFEVVGLGSGNGIIDGKLEETFFVVVKSDDLLKIRKEIERLFISRGGLPGAFSAEKFEPHITVGFTKRDLYEADGISKSERSLDPRFTLVVD